MKIHSVAITKLHTDPENARKHDTKNLVAIKNSLEKFGQQKPIIVGKNMVIVAGNGTYQSAVELGWKKIDCVYTDLEGDEAKAYAIADNRTAELADWDDEVLTQQLLEFDEELRAIAYDDFKIDDEEVAPPDLQDGDKEPFEQMTITLHADQAEVVKDAIKKAKKGFNFDDSPNQNSNGNAIAAICGDYLGR